MPYSATKFVWVARLHVGFSDSFFSTNSPCNRQGKTSLAYPSPSFGIIRGTWDSNSKELIEFTLTLFSITATKLNNNGDTS